MDDPARAFDFWIGSWAVTDSATGRLAGHNTIERAWVSSDGMLLLLLLLDGGLREGAIELQGGAGGPEGAPVPATENPPSI